MTTGYLSPIGVEPQFFSNAGSVLSSGKIATYLAGTTTSTPTYTDDTLATANTNPIILSSAGRLPSGIWQDGGVPIKVVISDSSNNVLMTIDNIAGIGDPATPGQQGLGQVLNPLTSEESSVGLSPTNYAQSASPVYDMGRYGITPNSATNPGLIDNSSIVQKVFEMAQATGGTMFFPCGDWSFYLDISGNSNPNIYVEGNGSTFRPYESTPTQSTVLYCNNGGNTNPYAAGVFHSSSVQIRNVYFSALKYTTTSGSGDINYCALFNGADATFYNCTFYGGILANLYGMFTQYLEFWSCRFGAVTGQYPIVFTAPLTGSSGTLTSAWVGPTGSWAINTSTAQIFVGLFTNGSTAVTWSVTITGSPTASANAIIAAGAVLVSDGLSAATNECLFARCKFFTGYNGIITLGTQMLRLDNCTFQDIIGLSGWTNQGALSLQADSTASFTGATVIRSCWFELNSAPHINGVACQSTVIDGCVFWPTAGGTSTIQFGTTAVPGLIYDLKVVNNQWLGGGSPTVSIVHSASDATTATLAWRGNGSGSGGPFAPTTLSLAHSGPTYIDLYIKGSFTGTLTGVSGTHTTTIDYTIEGDCVDLKLPALIATSTSDSCTITGAPALIYPSSIRYGCCFIQNSSALANGNCDITTAGVIDLYLGASLTGFSVGGNKGSQGGVFRYPLFS